MEEKKIVFKSIDEQLAEDERREAAKVDASRRSPGKAVEEAVTGTKSSNGPRKGRGKLRLKKSVRRTIGSLMLATSVVVAAVPVGGVSADSSGVYQGSKVPSYTYEDNTDASEYDVDAVGTSVGGFPLVTEADDNGGDKFTPHIFQIGGRNFYKVNTSGYSDVKPIFVLGKDGTKPAQYLKEYIGEDLGVYVPPSGNLNLVTGYVTNTSVSPWEYQDPETLKYYLYKPTIETTNVDGVDLYSEKIEVFGEAGIYHTVKFISEGATLITLSVEDGKTVPTGSIPPNPTPSDPTKEFNGWAPLTTQPITADTEFVAQFKDKVTSTPKAGEITLPATDGINPEGDANLSNAVEGGTVTGSPEENPTVTPTEPNTETSTDTNSTTDGSASVNSEPEINAGETSSGSGTDQTASPEADATNVVNETVESEHADAGGFGLTGILLQTGPAPANRQYEDVPIETYYVCDNVNTPYNPINYICKSAFEKTTNVQHVQVPEFIYKIGEKSFYQCTGLADITFGGGLQSVGSSCFEDCTGLNTVYYKNSMALKTIGAKAFMNSGLKTFTMDPDETVRDHQSNEFTIPYSVTKIGNMAFYGTNMKSVDFLETNNCEVGNFAFGNCDSLVEVDLTPTDTSNINIKNLTEVEGLFADCNSLQSAIMPPSLNGMLKKGTFGGDEKFNYIKFQSDKGYFDTGEFDEYQITVEGPQPSTLDTTSSSVASYVASVDVNNYVYRYHDADNVQHEVAKEYGYSSDDNFFDDTKRTTSKELQFIFDVEEPSYTLTDYFDKNKSSTGFYSPVDLEIGNQIGARGGGDISILAIADGVFENNTNIRHLQLNSNLNSIGEDTFRSTNIEKVWANVDGTAFSANSFTDNSKLERVTFAYGGEGGSSLGDNSFGNTPKLNNVDFYDDNLTTGDKSLYARFFKGSIAANAFYTNGRTDGVTFKGPMLESYAPYEFAIDPASKISNNQIYTKYYSGNPWNMTAQYTVEAFTKKNPVSGKDIKYSGVCLLKYPNMSSRMDKDDIDDDINDLSEKVTVDNLEAKTASSRTTMEQDCITYTRNITVPYGIDYIDVAKSQIHDTADKNYLVYDDSDVYTGGDNLYKADVLTDPNYSHITVGGDHYYMFKYNPDISSVRFESGGVSEFPDRMFEGARNLESVTFAGDVANIGNLPFYMPDTEALASKYTSYDPNSFPHLGPGNNDDTEFRSHLESVTFTGESSDATASNEQYYTSTDEYGFFSGIIKSNNGSRVKAVQIVPSRGDYCGAESITADELSDVDEYADYAARDCDAIKTVVFPEDGCEISYGCFMDCDRLKNVTMPNQFTSVGDRAFASISTNMDVTFPYNNVNLKELPFKSSSKDGRTTPDVTFHVHNDAEYLMDYADKNDNISYETIADAIKLTYRDRYDDTYYQVVEAQANGYTFGSNYPPSVLPSYGGKNPSTWSGIDKNGNTVNWNTDVLTTDTTFTSVYGSTDEKVKVYFVDYNGDPIKTVTLNLGSILTADKMPSVPEHVGMKFLYWSPNLEGEEITENVTVTAKYESSSTTSTTSTTSSTGGGTTSGGSTSGSSTSRSSSSSSSSRSSSSSSSSTALPVFVNSQDAGAAAPVSAAGVNSTVYVGEGSGSGSTGSGSGNGRGSGNTTVISTAGGITDTGKISATVNGSSDNYVIKITQTQEADDAGLSALHGKYGDDISAIRYLPFDISLYDSTGTNKISPVPEGVSVSITMPIPDDLAIYGGNAKIASTAGGVLDPMTPRFTVINGVPCMTYTCTHFSPYMVWVDTANLTEAGIMDATPKTADGIHPKWFLCFGLAAIAVVMFLKKDPEEYLKKKAA